MEDDLELLSYQQVAKMVQCDEKTLRDKFVKTGLLIAVRLGRSIRFRPSDVSKFIATLTTYQAEAK